MKRLAVLLVTALFAGVLALVPVSPAAADTDLCAGVGSANLDQGFVYPVIPLPLSLPAPRHANFNFGVTTGACVPSLGGLSAAGTVDGYCGLSNGSGSTSEGHGFAFTGIGSLLILTGGVVGVVDAIPNVLAGESCTDPSPGLSGGANNFIIVGASLEL